ncbi:MAG TPA: hypothetical protein VN328_04835 [Thermodesulfovibrionales bacterium]|nr:hypothetical protein [Thermodesulfovibrionales bacterium]
MKRAIYNYSLEGILMKRTLVVLVLVLIVGLLACAADRGKELFETAKFEELQNNKEHAMELYAEIIKKYPKSEYAGKAEERLKAFKQQK